MGKKKNNKTKIGDIIVVPQGKEMSLKDTVTFHHSIEKWQLSQESTKTPSSKFLHKFLQKQKGKNN